MAVVTAEAGGAVAALNDGASADAMEFAGACEGVEPFGVSAIDASVGAIAAVATSARDLARSALPWTAMLD